MIQSGPKSQPKRPIMAPPNELSWVSGSLPFFRLAAQNDCNLIPVVSQERARGRVRSRKPVWNSNVKTLYSPPQENDPA